MWVPEPELRHKTICNNDGLSYNLYFVFHLTNKDYLRRILDLVAEGTGALVRKVSEEMSTQLSTERGQWEPLTERQEGDPYFVLKCILGRTFKEKNKIK